MKTSKKVALFAALVGVLGVSSVIKTVYASPTQNMPKIAEVSDGDGEASDTTEAPENIQMSRNHSMQMIAQNQIRNKAEKSDGETNDGANEEQEDAKLQSLAKITAKQAKQAAETSVGGQASNVKLENENGNLVYAVVIGKKEVKVDAGNGKVLYTENGEENEKNEASRPKSSIQVANNDSSDKETNDDGK